MSLMIEKWVVKDANSLVGIEIHGDLRRFLSSTGTMHMGMPTEADKTMCNISTANMVLQASGLEDDWDGLCGSCKRVQISKIRKTERGASGS